MSIFDQWKLTPAELDEIISANPSLRGITLGYVAEHKLRKMWFSDERISDLVKYDDHNRSKKGDVAFTYKGVEISVEVKSVQTSSVHRVGKQCTGKVQCDASDRRRVTLPNRRQVETTCLVVGEFDLLAVNLFPFENEWQFAFARNQDLPRTSSHKYKPSEQKYLLATLIEVCLPLELPFESEPFRLLDKIVVEKTRAR